MASGSPLTGTCQQGGRIAWLCRWIHSSTELLRKGWPWLASSVFIQCLLWCMAGIQGDLWSLCVTGSVGFQTVVLPSSSWPTHDLISDTWTFLLSMERARSLLELGCGFLFYFKLTVLSQGSETSL